ncbi:hypothetical protein L0B53_00075 [Vibrio sp. SS-MA-C1-2]|nr:hypothetical protein [Vibrio sp. SS-MA-C1-2]UJF17209.1 hypothetical protein L0B53_00075 [Vibrio sp. SS-MA-C1-2]
MLGRGASQKINDGDLISIGEYRLLVSDLASVERSDKQPVNNKENVDEQEASIFSLDLNNNQEIFEIKMSGDELYQAEAILKKEHQAEEKK